MKKTNLLFAVIFLSKILVAQRHSTKEQMAIQQTVVKLFTALSNRDSISLKACCTADITFYEYGQVWNIDTLISKAITQNQSPDYKRSNNFEFINTAVDKQMAWDTYQLQSSIILDGKQSQVRWLETVVLVKKSKQWKVKHLHSTLIKRS